MCICCANLLLNEFNFAIIFSKNIIVNIIVIIRLQNNLNIINYFYLQTSEVMGQSISITKQCDCMFEIIPASEI